MKKWLMHLAEKERLLARRVLEETIAASDNGLRVDAGKTSSHQYAATVRRAVELRGVRSAVHLTLRDGSCSLQTPATRASMANTFMLTGPSEGGAARRRSYSAVILRTLKHWHARLSAADTIASVPEAEAMRMELAELMVGAAERHGVAWDRAWLNSVAPGRHAIYLEPTDRRLGERLRFDTRGPTYGDGTLSQSLVDVLDAIVGDSVHVSEWHARSPSAMPGISIGTLPIIDVVNPDDPIMKMQGLRSLPPGPVLIPPVAP